MILVYIGLLIETCLMRLYSKISPYRKFFPILLMLTFALVMGLRFNVGVDYPTYADMYSDVTHPARASVEPIWIFIYDSLNFLGFKSRMFFFLTSLLIVGGYYEGFKKMSPDIYLSFIVFIACGLYGLTGNIVRQCCAQAILFAGTPLLLNRKWIPFILVVAIASAFHFSAIVGAFIMMLCLIHFPLWILVCCLIVTFIFGNILMNIFAGYMPLFSAAVNKYNYDLTTHDPGVSSGMLRYVYNLVGIFIFLINGKLHTLNKNVYVFVNLTIVGICWYNVFFMFMEINRLSNYWYPYLMILIPYAVRLFKVGSKGIAIGTLITVLLLFVFKSDFKVPYSFDLNFI